MPATCWNSCTPMTAQPLPVNSPAAPIRSWLRIALVNFLVAALLGALLRYAFVAELAWMNFRFVQHGHSHVAMLGWLYLALYALLIGTFLPESAQNRLFYRQLFWLTQLSVLGMLLTFPLQGYAAGSIAFSTLHVLCSYAFAWRFLRDLRGAAARLKASGIFVRAGIWLMLLSSMGLWAMGPVMALDPGKGVAYYMAVQFYLHFQFNGWYVFAVLALFFHWMEKERIPVNPGHSRPFFWLLLASCLLTYALALTWANPLDALFYVNSAGVLLQLAALYFFLRMVQAHGQAIRARWGGMAAALFFIAFASFCLKILFQAAAVIPVIATVAYTIRNFVIGFFHLVLLGIITHFVLGYALQVRLLYPGQGLVRWGLYLFMVGFLLSEAVLFGQGVMLWAALGFLPGYYALLFGVSVLMPLGILLLALDRRGYLPP